MLDASLKMKMSNPIVKTDKYFQIDLGLNITSSDRFLEKGVFKRDIFQNELSDQSDQIKIMLDENLLNVDEIIDTPERPEKKQPNNNTMFKNISK